MDKVRRNQGNAYDLAIAALAKRLYGNANDIGEESLHRQSQTLSRAINALSVAVSETAQAAFTPQSFIDYATADVSVNTDTWTDIDGLERDIVAPIPCRLEITLQLDALCVAPAADALEVRCLVNASSQLALGFSVMFSVDERHPVVTIDLLDIFPGTIYTAKAQARVAATGFSDYTILGENGRSAMRLRLEPRPIIPTSG